MDIAISEARRPEGTRSTLKSLPRHPGGTRYYIACSEGEWYIACGEGEWYIACGEGEWYIDCSEGEWYGLSQSPVKRRSGDDISPVKRRSGDDIASLYTH